MPAEGSSGRLVVSLQEEAGHWSSIEGDIQKAVADCAVAVARSSVVGRGVAEACVALSSDDRVRLLNLQFRGKNKPTNVLSFPAPAWVTVHHRDADRNLGDIILAYETVMAEAREQEISPLHHVQHLVVHGLLHLLGYDHETDADAARMEALEVEILSSLGIADPYAAAALADPD